MFLSRKKKEADMINQNLFFIFSLVDYDKKSENSIITMS